MAASHPQGHQAARGVYSLVTEETAHYRIPPSKSREAARKILGGYRGTALADGYAVYKTLSERARSAWPTAGHT